MITQNNAELAQKCINAATVLSQKPEEMHEMVRELIAVVEGKGIKSRSDELPQQDAGAHADRQTA